MDDKRTVPYTNKRIEVAPGIMVICGGSVTVSYSGHESARDRLVIVTKRGVQELDNSSYFIDLQSATLEGEGEGEGKEVVVKWTKLEKHYEERWSYYEVNGQCYPEDWWIEEVEERRQCEKRIPV